MRGEYRPFEVLLSSEIDAMLRRLLLAVMIGLALAPCGTAEAVAPPEHGPAPFLQGPIYGFGMPSQRWSWRGTQYRSYSVFHRGFYNDRYDWSYRRGY